MKSHSHLIEQVKPLLKSSTTAKIDFIRKDSWIGYPSAHEILSDFDALLSHPKAVRMPCRALIGDPSNGKTTILKHWFKKHNFTQDESDVIEFPAVLIETPPEPSEKRLYGTILNSLGIVHRDSFSETKLLNLVVDRFKTFKVRLLVADEFHNMLHGQIRYQHKFLAALKNLLNALQLPIVVAGTPDILRALATDYQFISRFEKHELPKWGANQETRSLIASIESILPFDEPSGLSEIESMTLILGVSDGTIGSILKPIRNAAIMAVEKGSSKIEITMLDKAVKGILKRKI
jgi:hypothetical protein